MWQGELSGLGVALGGAGPKGTPFWLILTFSDFSCYVKRSRGGHPCFGPPDPKSKSDRSQASIWSVIINKMYLGQHLEIRYSEDGQL